MRTFSVTLIRLFAAAMLALLVSSVISPETQAQPCKCDFVIVALDPGVCSPVVVQPSGLNCRYDVVRLQPGDVVQIPCCEDMKLRIITCNETDATFNMDGTTNCLNPVPVARGCCVQGCSSIDPSSGCPVLYISSSGLKCPLC